jgi:hypothetical protein
VHAHLLTLLMVVAQEVQDAVHQQHPALLLQGVPADSAVASHEHRTKKYAACRTAHIALHAVGHWRVTFQGNASAAPPHAGALSNQRTMCFLLVDMLSMFWCRAYPASAACCAAVSSEMTTSPSMRAG